MTALPEAVYALTEPKKPGYEVLGSSEQAGENRQTGEMVDRDMRLWYLAKDRRGASEGMEKRKRVPGQRKHSGRLRKAKRVSDARDTRRTAGIQ